MTELDFKLRNPNIYGGGSMNLLYSSSRDSGSLPLPVSQIPTYILEEYAGSGIPVPDPNIPSSSTDTTEPGIYDNVTSSLSPSGYLYTLKDAFFPPYTIIGLTISFSSLNNVKLEDTLRQVKFLIFKVGSDKIKVKVLSISKLTDYYYLQVKPIVFKSMSGNTDSSGTLIDFSVEVSFIDYLSGEFTNSDYDVLLGNVLTLKTSTAALQVDRNTDSATPSNLSAIITETATLAQVQYSNYTTTGWTNARYEGSINIPIQERDLPAASYIMFEGAIHPVDADTDTILTLGIGDSGKTKLYFNVESRPTDFIPSGSTLLSSSTFPIAGGSNSTPLVSSTSFEQTLVDLDKSIIYTDTTAFYGGSVIFKEDGNKLVRVVSSKIHAVNKGSVYTTDEFGIAINEAVSST